MGKHRMIVGLSTVLAYQYEASSSFAFAHTVQANPLRLTKNGSDTWSYNTSSTYFRGLKYFTALYAFDEWRPVRPLLVKTGLRLKPLYNDVFAVPRIGDETKNRRIDGFSLSNPEMCEIHHFQQRGLDYAVSEHVSWHFKDKLSLIAEGYFSMTNKTTTYYRNSSLPSLKPIGNALGRGGLTYVDNRADCSLIVAYITSWNKADPVNVTKQVNGISETIPWVAQYGIGTFSVTADGTIRLGTFHLHARATWQDPKYLNYSNDFVFSDGSVTSIDYSGNCVTGISKFMVELDPSYQWRGLRIWGSLRYFSRQYVSRTNKAYFNGHFETFAGADYRFKSHHKISMNLVNMLFQSGAKGSIEIADTIEDADKLQNLAMAGSYMRPFTVDISYTYSF